MTLGIMINVAAIAKALEAVTTSDVKGWFEPCGYQYTKT
jgi:hypothetical protein